MFTITYWGKCAGSLTFFRPLRKSYFPAQQLTGKASSFPDKVKYKKKKKERNASSMLFRGLSEGRLLKAEFSPFN